MAMNRAVMFQVLETEMGPYLIRKIGPALEDYELAVTFQYVKDDDDPVERRRLASTSVVSADVAVTLMLSHANIHFVENFSQEEINRIVSSKYAGPELRNVKESMVQQGISVTSVSSNVPYDGEIEDAVPEEEPSPNSGTGGGKNSKSNTGLIAGLVAGSLVLLGLITAILCRSKRYRPKDEEWTLNTTKPLDMSVLEPLPPAKPPTFRDFSIADGTASLIATDDGVANPETGPVLMDAPVVMRIEPNGETNKPQVCLIIRDDGSLAESTLCTRSGLLENSPVTRPEYTNKRRGQRWRPWNRNSDENKKKDKKGWKPVHSFPRNSKIVSISPTQHDDVSEVSSFSEMSSVASDDVVLPPGVKRDPKGPRYNEEMSQATDTLFGATLRDFSKEEADEEKQSLQTNTEQNTDGKKALTPMERARNKVLARGKTGG